jgi:hypothetical protein
MSGTGVALALAVDVAMALLRGVAHPVRLQDVLLAVRDVMAAVEARDAAEDAALDRDGASAKERWAALSTEEQNARRHRAVARLRGAFETNEVKP